MQKTAPKTSTKKTGSPPPEERHSIMPRNDTSLEAALKVRDRTVVEYDARWGTDVLQTLVSPETAARFAKVRNRLDAAIEAHNKAVDANEAQEAADTAITTMAVEMRGLKAMEEEAITAGRKPLQLDRAWAFQLHDGTQAVLVQTDEDARAARRHDRFKGWAIYSIREIGIILSERSLLGVLDAKKAFPEATVEAIKPAVNWKRGDEVPF